jgi:hypothetical protein
MEKINTIRLCMLVETKLMRFEVLAAVSMKSGKFLPGYMASHLRIYYSFELLHDGFISCMVQQKQIPTSRIFQLTISVVL